MKKIAFAFLAALFIVTLTNCQSDTGKVGTNDNQKNMKEETMSTEKTVAVLETNMGTIEIELFPDITPKAVENFTGLANKGYYNGIIFHRVIKDFMIQGGDPTGTGSGGESIWGKSFEDEFSPDLQFDEPGYLAMANAGPNTNGSQFFITVVPTAWLNGHHTIFGKVIKGMDVVYAISKVQTGPGDKPVKDVVMQKVTIEKRTASE